MERASKPGHCVHLKAEVRAGHTWQPREQLHLTAWRVVGWDTRMHACTPDASVGYTNSEAVAVGRWPMWDLVPRSGVKSLILIY